MNKFSEKYRPIDDALLVGRVQNAALATLLKQRPQTVLFTGPSGTGKTTISKIYAGNLLNCAVPDLVGNINFQHVNSREVGISFFREQLIENMGVPPMFGDYRVYLFDEVDGLKKDTEQAILLTLLENLPKHIVLIFSTLNPNGLRPDFLSRLKPHFHLTSPTSEEQKRHMLAIFKNEGIQVKGHPTEGATKTISEKEAKQIFETSKGNLRTLLDNIEAWSEGHFTADIEEAEQSDFVRRFIQGIDQQGAFRLAADIDNPNATLHGLCGYAIAMLKKSKNKTAEKTLRVFGQGLNQNVSEKVAFYHLLMLFYSE